MIECSWEYECSIVVTMIEYRYSLEWFWTSYFCASSWISSGIRDIVTLLTKYLGASRGIVSIIYSYLFLSEFYKKFQRNKDNPIWNVIFDIFETINLSEARTFSALRVSLFLFVSVKTCGLPLIDSTTMSNLTVRPGDKVTFNCKVCV